MTEAEEPSRLFVADVAARLNLAASTVHRYRRRPEMHFPEPDGWAPVSGGLAPYWFEGTIDGWNANRPGPGTRTDLQ